MDPYTPYISVPAPFAPLTPQQQKQCEIQLPRSDNDTIMRQSCMMTASGEMVCDERRRDGHGMIVRQPCSRPPAPAS